MNPALWLCAAVLAASIPPEISGSSPDAATIVCRSVEANVRNYNALPDFNYFRVEREQDGAKRTYEEKMLFGSRCSRLVALHGEPLSPEREKYEEMMLAEAIRLRAGESVEQRRSSLRSLHSPMLLQVTAERLSIGEPKAAFNTLLTRAIRWPEPGTPDYGDG